MLNAVVLFAAALACPIVLQPAGTAAAPTTSVAARAAGVAAERWSLDEGVPLATKASDLTALDRYVREDDGAFKWELVRTDHVPGITVYNIALTSQRWRSAEEISHPLWTHYLTIGVPDRIQSATPIFVIGGGRRRETPRDTPPGELSLLVRSSGAVVCYLDNIPNQPMTFPGETEGRSEDDFLAHTWNLAIRDNDSRWIGRFPMVKAVVKGMDAAEQFLSRQDLSPAAMSDDQPLKSGFKPDGFFVTGASKRGWTTWLVAAVDKQRCRAIAPLVIDVLNLQDHTPHHFASYGFWAPALDSYTKNGIDKKFGSPELARVIAHEDPAAYLARIGDMPRYIVTATGDEFFPTDSARHYEKLLSGEWHLRSVPNAAHSLSGSPALLDTLAFYKAVVRKAPRPSMTWDLSPADGADTLNVTTSAKPSRVSLWTCDNPKARDFRLDQTGKTWKSTDVAPASGSPLRYSARVERPASGYRAFFIECVFTTDDAQVPPLTFTTRVFITPDTLPFAK
jgi:PhoPQ-activated pathogenicity-related protein